MSDLVSDLHYLATGMRLMGSAFNDALVDKAAERIAELEQRLERQGVTDEQCDAIARLYLGDTMNRLNNRGVAAQRKAIRAALKEEQ